MGVQMGYMGFAQTTTEKEPTERSSRIDFDEIAASVPPPPKRLSSLPAAPFINVEAAPVAADRSKQVFGAAMLSIGFVLGLSAGLLNPFTAGSQGASAAAAAAPRAPAAPAHPATIEHVTRVETGARQPASAAPAPAIAPVVSPNLAGSQATLPEVAASSSAMASTSAPTTAPTSPAPTTPVVAAIATERAAGPAADASPGRPTLAAAVVPSRSAPATQATRPVAEPTAVAPTATTPPPSAGAAPAQPTREQVQASLETVRNDVAGCGAGAHGAASVRVTVDPSGRVRSAIVSGDFQGTPVGSCIARVVRGARFPAFSDASLVVSYPYQF